MLIHSLGLPRPASSRRSSDARRLMRSHVAVAIGECAYWIILQHGGAVGDAGFLSDSVQGCRIWGPHM